MKKLLMLTLAASLGGYIVGCAKEEPVTPAPLPATGSAGGTTGGHTSGTTGGHASPGGAAAPAETPAAAPAETPAAAPAETPAETK
jgi:hypothetical protein